MTIPGRAVLFYSTADPAYNTTPPTGALADSGWQYEGSWRNYLGTAIAPHYFISASHIGGAVGEVFVLNGVSYTTTALFDDPDTDLRIWRVCGAFPAYAPLYTASNEVGKGIVDVGTGTQRGDPVTTAGNKNNGWHWGNNDGVRRWGENVVAKIVDFSTITSGLGQMLQMNFDANGGANECDLSTGDSGGGVFIKDGQVWKLAGINYGITAQYRTSSNGDTFSAAIYDEGGLYRGAGSTFALVSDVSSPQPGGFYATRISSRVAWINSVISAPVPPVLESASDLTGPYSDASGALTDTNTATITLPVPEAQKFYRLRSECAPPLIIQINLTGSGLVISYR